MKEELQAEKQNEKCVFTSCTVCGTNLLLGAHSESMCTTQQECISRLLYCLYVYD